MSEREYTLTVTLKRTFQRKVKGAKHRAEVVGRIERALPAGWAVAKSSIRAGASKTQQTRTKRKQRTKREVERALKAERKLRHIDARLPEREFMAMVLKKEKLDQWEIRLARNNGGRCIYHKRRILVGPTSTTEPGYMGYARLKTWAAKEGIDATKINRPLCVFLHEVAHACDFAKNGGYQRPGLGKRRTPHGKKFRREYRRLLKKYAPQVFGLPVKDRRTLTRHATAALR